MVPTAGIEPATSCLPCNCSTVGAMRALNNYLLIDASLFAVIFLGVEDLLENADDFLTIGFVTFGSFTFIYYIPYNVSNN